jgi:hypothetical protein
MKTNQKNILLAAALIVLVAIARIVTREFHLYNLAPVGALALFTATIISDKRIAVATPLLAMLLADLFFQAFTNFPGFYGQEQWFVYGGMMLVSALGLTMGKPKAVKILGYTLAGSMVFFLVSNLGSFLSGMWGTGFDGLVKTYTMAIPFYQYSIAGELIGATVLFGAHHLLTVGKLKTAAQRA